MAKSQLVMAGCKGPHETCDYVLRGSERIVRVSQIGEGGVVVLVIQNSDLSITDLVLPEGETPFPTHPVSKYKLRKSPGPRPVSTSVEIIHG